MSDLYKQKASFTAITIFLIILLGIRAFFSIILIGFHFLFLIMGIIYVTALVGTSSRKQYGGVVTICIGILDILLGVTMFGGGEESMPAFIYDVVLIILGFIDMGTIDKFEKNLSYGIATGYRTEQTPSVRIVPSGNPAARSYDNQYKNAVEPSSNYCSNCGQKVNTHSKFCESCGERLV